MMLETFLPALAFTLLGFGLPAEQDKLRHFSMGAAGALIAEEAGERWGAPRWVACGASLGLGFAKEVYDSHGHGNVDPWDVAATGAGCAVTFRF